MSFGLTNVIDPPEAKVCRQKSTYGYHRLEEQTRTGTFSAWTK
jgi:hypothetical protein